MLFSAFEQYFCDAVLEYNSMLLDFELCCYFDMEMEFFN